MSFEGPHADRLAIRELIDAYCDAVAQGDADAWAATWTDDAEWNVGGHSYAGKAAMVSAWRGMMEGFAFAGFSAVPGMIEIDGDAARLRVHTAETLFLHSGDCLRIWGRYDDDLVRHDGRWLFARRTYTVLRQA